MPIAPLIKQGIKWFDEVAGVARHIDVPNPKGMYGPNMTPPQAQQLLKGNRKGYEAEATRLYQSGVPTQGKGNLTEAMGGGFEQINKKTGEPDVVNPGWKTGKDELRMTPQGSKARKDADRIERIRQQSTGADGVQDPPMASVGTMKAKGQTKGDGSELHHWNSIVDRSPAYEGLSNEDGNQLTQMFRDYGWGSGDELANLLKMMKDDHHVIHNFLRAHGIERTGTRSESLRNLFKDKSLEERFELVKRLMVWHQGQADAKLGKMGFEPPNPKHNQTMQKAVNEDYQSFMEAAPDVPMSKSYPGFKEIFQE